MVGVNTSVEGGIAVVTVYLIQFCLKEIMYQHKKIGEFIQE